MYKKIKAFTLIELLVVIAIVGILTGFIFVSMNNAVSSAKDTKRKADLSTISKAIMAYMAQNNNAYPYTATTTACNLCNNDSCTNPCTGFYANIQPYLSNIPLDPNGSTYYTYTYSATPKFVLQSTLSNTYTYQYDSTSGFSTFFNFVSTCTAATNAQVSCTAITISSTEEACRCIYLSGAGTTTWSTPNGVTQVQYLVVGGGGAGSTSQDGPGGGGGGAGGLLAGTESVGAGPFTVKVGTGGTSRNNNAGSSTFNDITALGGGVGGAGGYSCNGGAGGSGAGSAGANCGAGSGTAGQGYAGGIGNGTYGATNTAGGGGGGAGGAGGNATSYTAYGAGGAGVASTITGSSVTYATGGNGNAYNGGAGAAGAANTGNGGQGGACQLVAGGSGGSGIVVLRYTHP